jgi:hypothetical protein
VLRNSKQFLTIVASVLLLMFKIWWKAIYNEVIVKQKSSLGKICFEKCWKELYKEKKL